MNKLHIYKIAEREREQDKTVMQRKINLHEIVKKK